MDKDELNLTEIKIERAQNGGYVVTAPNSHDRDRMLMPVNIGAFTGREDMIDFLREVLPEGAGSD